LEEASLCSPLERLELAQKLLATLEESLPSGGEQLSISCHLGDITKIDCDALATLVNSRGEWGVRPSTDDGGWEVVNPRSVDAAIFSCAREAYHRTALALRGACEGTTLLAAYQAPHEGAFRQVLFVVDDWAASLPALVEATLVAADQAGLQSLAMPLFRTGAAVRTPGTLEEKVEAILRVLRGFRPRHLRRVTLGTVSQELHQVVLESLHDFSPTLSVLLGDITQVDSDALITGLNSEGAWGGGVDRAIYGVAGSQFHDQAQDILGADDGTVVIVPTQVAHPGAFRHVVFVADDLRLPLYDIVSKALKAADDAGFTSVTLPTMRMGVLMDFGGPPEQKIEEMARAVKDFGLSAQSITSISFVIYGDPTSFELLRNELGMS
jgi:O-acetyl-ADP-ribose deacetylase (regulator of RNase III)